MPRRLLTLALSFLAALVATAPARAQNIYYANFDSPFYTLGSLLSQGGWTVDPSGNADVSSLHASNGTQSARFSAAGTSGTTWWYTPLNHTVTPAKPLVEVSFDCRLPLAGSPSGAWGVQVYDPSLAIFAFVFRSSTNGRVFLLDYSINTAVDTGFAMQPDRWYRWSILLNFTTRKYRFFIDGVQIGTEIIFDDFIPPGNTVADADIRVTTPGSDAFFVDNYRVRALSALPCDADVNNDRAVNTQDLTQVLAAFGQTVTPAQGPDFNGDATVNTQDLVFFLAAFGSPCP